MHYSEFSFRKWRGKFPVCSNRLHGVITWSSHFFAPRCFELAKEIRYLESFGESAYKIARKRKRFTFNWSKIDSSDADLWSMFYGLGQAKCFTISNYSRHLIVSIADSNFNRITKRNVDFLISDMSCSDDDGGGGWATFSVDNGGGGCSTNRLLNRRASLLKGLAIAVLMSSSMSSLPWL